MREGATIDELGSALDTGRLGCAELTGWYLDRIARLDRDGPRLHAVIETNPDALRTAAARDRELRDTGRRGPLHGIPVLLKDTIDTADAMHTTGGSTAMLGSRPNRDAGVAAALRAAGAVLLGKTNLTGWITGSSGWSPRGGQCRNPYRLDRTPHGSSAGSAVAVSADLCAAAIGVETVGSILGPASANGVVGLKPTVGVTSRAGVMPGVASMDSVGPLARTVADAVAVLDAVAVADPRDPASLTARRPGPLRRHLDPHGLSGARIGVVRTYFGLDDHADAVAEAALDAMARAGAVLVDDVTLPSPDELAARGDLLATVQFRQARHHKDVYLASTPGEHPRSVAELVEWNRAHAGTELCWFGQESLEMIAGFDDDVTGDDFRRAVTELDRLTREDGIDAALRAHDVDSLVMPTLGPAWPIDLVNGDRPIMGSALVPGLAGYPAVNVPAGSVHDLPVGVTLTGTAGSEPELVRVASGFENVTRHRRAPAFAPGGPGL